MTEDDLELVAEFRTESLEHFDQVEPLLLEIESSEGPERADALNAIFRAVHSVKGAAGFFGLDRIQDLAHVSETLLMKVRDGELRYRTEMTDVLLGALDTLRRLVEALPETLDLPIDHHVTALGRVGALPSAASSEESIPDPAVHSRSEEATGKPGADEPKRSLDAPTAGSAKGGRASGSGETIRVSVRLLDRLMNLGGELVLARNQLVSRLSDVGDAGLRSVVQNIDQTTSRIQGEIMNTRMQPVGSVFTRFTRVVRDLSRSLGKRAELELLGTEVGLDKSIIEHLGDPLTHLVRNAMDHGVETPEERAAAGKEPVAKVVLRAYHEDGLVNIEIADDGRGIDPAAMRRTAVRKGLLEEEAAQRMSDADATMLIFAPGFSSVETVSDVSGRGVGMDVVRANIQKLGGKLDVHSVVGMGTTIRVRLPLTLAILPSLIASIGEERFAVPQVNLVEVVSVHGDSDVHRVESVRGAPTLRHRGGLLPLVWLAQLLGIPGDHRIRPGDPDATAKIVVLRIDQHQFGLVVDEIVGTEEIVVKPRSEMLKECKAFAGTTIMGDGRVAMILDVSGVATEARLLFDESQEADGSAEAAEDDCEQREILLFTSSPTDQFAVELDRIVRLERITREQIERLGGQEFIQHDGAGLPLVRLEDRLDVDRFEPAGDDLYVVIPRLDGKGAGILVREVVDTVKSDFLLERDGSEDPAVVGRAVVAGRLTMFLDPAPLLEAVPRGKV